MMRVLVLMGMLVFAGCASQRNDDERYAHVQDRGKQVMGVDQYTSTHTFETLSDGGRIELQRNDADSADIAQIRKHMQDIRAAFTNGDFRMPGMVHDMVVPGTVEMAKQKGALTYEYRELPRGGEVRIRAGNAEALKAVHEFLAFQRMDHRAHGGH